MNEAWVKVLRSIPIPKAKGKTEICRKIWRLPDNRLIATNSHVLAVVPPVTKAVASTMDTALAGEDTLAKLMGVVNAVSTAGPYRVTGQQLLAVVPVNTCYDCRGTGIIHCPCCGEVTCDSCGRDDVRPVALLDTHLNLNVLETYREVLADCRVSITSCSRCPSMARFDFDSGEVLIFACLSGSCDKISSENPRLEITEESKCTEAKPESAVSVPSASETT